MELTSHARIARHIISDELNLGFSAAQYSRFKYGSKDMARKFGKDLGYHMINSGYFEVVKEKGIKQLVVLPSPYYFIPTATFALKDYFIATINEHLVKLDMSPVEELKIWRKPGYVTDYGKMSAAERQEAIGSENFHVDVSFCKGKHLLFLDDIRITGGHENRILEMIDRLSIGEHCQFDFIYYALLSNEHVCPTLEDKLNLYSMRNLYDLDKIIKNENFLFNTRNVKFILDADPSECRPFLLYQRKTFLETLYHNAIGNGYHLAQKFMANMKILSSILNS